MSTLGTFVMTVGRAVDAEQAPLKISICRLLISPGRYQSRLLEISGKVRGGIHGIIIFGKSCPDIGMDFLIDNSILERADVKPLFDAVYKPLFIDEDKRDITATVIGKFQYSGSSKKRSAFELDRVLDLKVRESARSINTR